MKKNVHGNPGWSLTLPGHLTGETGPLENESLSFSLSQSTSRAGFDDWRELQTSTCQMLLSPLAVVFQLHAVWSLL